MSDVPIGPRNTTRLHRVPQGELGPPERRTRTYRCSLRATDCRRFVPGRIEIGHSSVIQASKLGASNHAHDNRLAGKLLSHLKSGSMLLADRGYDADWVRAAVSERGAWANIPPRCNRNEPICFSPRLFRARNLVERFFNRIKQCRRIVTRYDKLAAKDLAFVQLASIRLWLRINEFHALVVRAAFRIDLRQILWRSGEQILHHRARLGKIHAAGESRF